LAYFQALDDQSKQAENPCEASIWQNTFMPRNLHLNSLTRFHLSSMLFGSDMSDPSFIRLTRGAHPCLISPRAY